MAEPVHPQHREGAVGWFQQLLPLFPALGAAAEDCSRFPKLEQPSALSEDEAEKHESDHKYSACSIQPSSSLELGPRPLFKALSAGVGLQAPWASLRAVLFGLMEVCPCCV